MYVYLHMTDETETDRPEPLKHTFSLTVEIDPFWIEYLTQCNDIFGTNYAGYWLRGVERDADGWLCWEVIDEGLGFGEEPDREPALISWAAGQPLPKGWYRLNRAAALGAWVEGVKMWGVNWYEDTDSTREDTVLQLALLGVIRYG